MRQSTYLNVILTANAFLLAGLLWTNLASTPVLAQSASAQAARATETQGGGGMVSAADQRQRMIESLNNMRSSLDAMKKTMDSGKLKVEVTNLGDIKRVEVSNIDQLRR